MLNVEEDFDKRSGLTSSTLDIENLENDIQRAIIPILSEINIIDPAVGVGYFLLSSFEVLVDIHKTLIKAKIQERTITDIEPDTCSPHHACRKSPLHRQLL